MTLTRYIQDLLEREVARPPADEVFDLVDASPAVQLDRPAAELVRDERADREQL